MTGDNISCCIDFILYWLVFESCYRDMFCADYVFAFVYHAFLTVGTGLLFQKEQQQQQSIIKKEQEGHENYKSLYKEKAAVRAYAALGLSPPTSAAVSLTNKYNYTGMTMMPVIFGLMSGLVTTITLYPFDFVRGGVLRPGFQRIIAASATVPYAGTLFGVYFTLRDPHDLGSQMKCALSASTCALVAEIPFDHAKKTMMGSVRVMLGVGLLYVPFASMMLVMYDKAAIRALTSR